MAGMTRIEMKPGPWRITDPDWPTFTPYDTKGIVLSDTFTGDGPLIGRATDSGIGGAPATWSGAGTATDWSTVGGVLRIRPGGVVVAGIPHTLTTFSLEVAVAGLPAAGGGNLWIEPWKAGTPTAAGGAALRMEITPSRGCHGGLAGQLPRGHAGRTVGHDPSGRPHHGPGHSRGTVHPGRWRGGLIRRALPDSDHQPLRWHDEGGGDGCLPHVLGREGRRMSITG